MSKRRRWLSLFALAAGAVAVVFPVSSATAAPDAVAVYSSIDAPMPGNVSSVGFQATQTAAFGDLVQLAPGPRRLDSVTVMMSSWGCESGGWSTAPANPCVTTPGATFSHPLTLSLYNSAPGTPTGVGSPVLTVTQPFDIPYRPSADPTCTGGDAGKWRSGSTCYNGFATPVTFTFDGSLQVPTNLIWALSYNTTSWGSAPLTTSADCYVESGGCGYDSLNVGLSTQSTPVAGVDVVPSSVVASAGTNGVDCAGGSRTLRVTAAGCWTNYRPMAEIKTLALSDTSTTRVVKAADTTWAFFAESTVGGQSGAYVTGPTTPPLGTGSAQLEVTASNQGQAFGASMLGGTRLDRLTALRYSSAQPAGAIAPALQFPVRYDGLSGAYQGRLVFEPIYTLGAGPVPAGWQTWNTLAGKWWATGAPGNTVCNTGTPCTWSQLLVAFPDAVINPSGAGVLFKIGSGIPAFTGHVDALAIGVDDGAGNIATTIYDFEPTAACEPNCTEPPAAPATPATSVTQPNGSGVPDFNPVTPTRVFDTRVGTPAYHRDVAKVRVAPGAPLEVKLTDLAGLVPASGVGAVSINLTSTQSQGDGYLTVNPCGVENTVSNLNFRRGIDRANAVITAVAATGTVCITSSVATDVVVDVNGWFKSPPSLHPVDPTRVFDTRAGAAPALREVPKTRLEPGKRLEVAVTDLPGLVPATGVGAVSINVTSTRSLSDGFVTVSPCTTDDGVSNVNFQADDDAANLVVAPVSAMGTVCFTASVATDLAVDINGWLPERSGFAPVNPSRVADTRVGSAGLRDVPKARVAPGDTLEVKLTDLPGLVPTAGVGAVSLSVTSTRSLGDGFLTVSPCGSVNVVSNVNFQGGRDRANAVLTPISPAGTVCITTSQPTDVIIDVNGWFSDSPTV